ncbi:MAG: hypothetical protein U0559_01095 [Anaerolineae bacterium]
MRGDNLTGDVTVRRGKRNTLSGGATPVFCAVPKITECHADGRQRPGVQIKITGTNFDQCDRETGQRHATTDKACGNDFGCACGSTTALHPARLQ